ncbi:hypothetical protein NERG_00749 [Nematocida ausubeli]|uniref:BRCT domain-containing protein n=1 Tax=Nematocida ausubeli (strain ATCC PRA-371 / ERTm2) TaxID=1913371 RepID=H8ZB00_NEMA1|nr:hypothetical protein NERG_00749 [Nematocida ausubeli]
MKPVQFTTTGLSSLEKSLIIRLFKGTEYILEETMTSSISYLLSNKSTFTEKRILAERWGIPVISIMWVYKSLSQKSILQFKLRKYEGCVFCTSGITNDLFINYYRLHGAYHSSVLTRYCDFLVVNSLEQDTDKIIYAKEWNIPIITAETVFDDRITFFMKTIQYESFISEPLTDEIFNGKIFYFEGETEIHKLVRRLIIEHGGNRVEEPGPDVDYSIYFGSDGKGRNLVWYQWILDSADLGTLLSSEGYEVHHAELPSLPLENMIIFPIVCKEEGLRTKNKVNALGGEVSMQISSKITHCIVERKSRQLQSKMQVYMKTYKIHVCFLEWLNQSIYYMKKLNENKFEMPVGLKTIPESVMDRTEMRKRASVKYMPGNLDGWKVQFTGLVDTLKEQAVKVLQEKGVAVIDSPEYSPECTHLIVGAVNVSLKFLCAIACGAVLMDYQVIDDLKQNTYTAEKSYNLETRNIKIDAPRNEKIIRKLIRAAPVWKAKKEKCKKKAFTGWRVHILATKDTARIEQLIENGGGEVVVHGADENIHKNSFYFVDAATKVPPEIPPAQIIEMKDIIGHLAQAKQIG